LGLHADLEEAIRAMAGRRRWAEWRAADFTCALARHCRRLRGWTL